MPTLIKSKVRPDEIAHIVFRREEITDQRTDIVDAKEGLQVAAFNLPLRGTFKPHWHIPRPREIPYTQETWIVVSGTIRVTYYDLEGGYLDKALLFPGDCSITLLGGHNYEGADERGSLIYEVKTGPFIGVSEDKKRIEIP